MATLQSLLSTTYLEKTIHYPLSVPTKAFLIFVHQKNNGTQLKLLLLLLLFLPFTSRPLLRPPSQSDRWQRTDRKGLSALSP